MLRRVKGMVSVLLASVMVISLVGCGDSSSKDEGAKKMAIVCSAAGQNDNGYNQSAVEGAKKVAEDLGLEYKIIEPTNGVPAALETLAEDGYNIIFNLEYDFEALIVGTGGSKPIAEMYPDTTFIVFNDNPNVDESGNVIHDNVYSVLFDVNEASYVAGALSVLVNENAEALFGTDGYNFTSVDEARAVGFVGGTNSKGITVFSYGFIEGINHVAEELGVTYDYYSKYDAGFADPATGSSVAGTFFNQGANIVYAVAGGVGDGVASKAKEEGKLAIHVDANKDDQQPGYILTSVIKNTEVPVVEITKGVVDGTLKADNNLLTYSLKTGAASITDLTTIESNVIDMDKWNEIKDYITNIEKQISDGEIKVVNAQEGEEFDPSVCPNVNLK
ncbi:MAG: BMP family protein [Sedimentibacter sp.]